MAKTCLDSFRRSKAFLLVVTFYSVTTQLVMYSIFHPILPFYLRTLYADNICEYNSTVTATPCETVDADGQISRAIGMVTGTGSAMQLVTSLFSGILLQKLSLHWNLVLSVSLNLLAPGLAFFAQGMITMCCANAAISAGALLTFITYYSILTERSSDDKERMRLVGLYNVFNGLGNVLGYSAASACYQFLGHKITFGILFGLIALDLVLRWLLLCEEEVPVEENEKDMEKDGEMVEKELTRSQVLKELGEAPEIDEEEDEGGWRDWLKYVSDPYVVLINVQTFFLFIAICTLCTTGPNFARTSLQAEQWQTGLSMGVGSGIELIALSATAALVTTHQRRWMTIFICCLLNAAGFFWYPFTSSVWEVMVPDSFIRVTKAVAIVFVGTLYPYISDCRGVGDCKMGYAIHGVFFSVGATLGSFGSGLVVASATFHWLYIAVGIMMVVAALTVLPFIKLQPPEEDVPNLALSRVSLASWMNRSRLSINDMSRSGLAMNKDLSISAPSIYSTQSCRRNRLQIPSNSSLYRTRSRTLSNNLATSMADMTLSRLSIGRALAL